MTQSGKKRTPEGVHRRLALVTWPFLAVIVVLVVLANESLNIVAASRAYVGGESLWSKAQKEAVYRLSRYTQSRSEEDFSAFRAAIAVPLGDRRARLELEKPDPDLAVVREGFIAGGNDPDDIAGMITLFRRFRDVGFMHRAIEDWTEGDEHIAALNAAAEELHAHIGGGDPPESLAPILTRIDDLNQRLTPLEVSFSSTLGEASRKTQQMLQLGLVLVAGGLVLGGAFLTRRMLRNSDALERALRISEERFDLAVSGSNVGVWDWNLKTGEVYYSPRYKKLLGYAEDEFDNKVESFEDHVHPDDHQAALTALHQHVIGETPYDVELRLRTRSGEYRWFQARGKSVRNRRGEAVRMAGAITDITERKQAEAQLFAERDRAQVTLESIGDAVITTDLHGHVEYLNPVAEALTGVSTDEAKGMPLSRVFRIVEERNRHAEVHPVAKLVQEARPVKLGDETILIRRDGGEFAIDASAAPIRDRASRMVGAVLVFNDVTRARRREAQLSYQARHDPLTGLVNRREFEHRLGQALASAAEFQRHHAVLYLDLDRFKEVNDTCGHAAGDAFLREIGVLLQSKLREGDTLARIGGDEFGVLLENCPPDHAARIADSLHQAVAKVNFSWQSRVFELGVSIGVVNVAEQRYTVAEVLSAADESCYRAKAGGRSQVHVFGAEDRADDRQLG
jgi:diguanylate cyclase (GGDEF)-like protein/PAS domain S-box-containing protein